MHNDLEPMTLELAQQLTRAGDKICTAESCTGGLIAKTLTDLAGSSAWFDRGFITYSNQSKMDMLGVKAATLQAYGAVSQEVAAEMAAGAQLNSEAEVAIAVTGVAGPAGGSEVKPVGTVCLGFAIGERVLSEKHQFDGDRQQVRQATLHYALKRINQLLQGG
ncbi:MAG: CinA family protein [Gammaproteobacteria bacterium]|nr:CinA family protein [Gammaproteobacteria bacterium]